VATRNDSARQETEDRSMKRALMITGLVLALLVLAALGTVLRSAQ
jgi:succinate dehydrogenase hydrophobic anchor subunit